MFSNLSRRRVAMLLVLTCMLFLTLDRSGNPVIDRARSGFAVVLKPFDTAAEAISRPLADAWNGITNYDELAEENERLRDQLENQRGAEIEARSAVLEYLELLKLNRLTSAGNYTKVAARVVGEAPSNFQNTVEINKGTADGIAVGMPVVSGAGLVGRITKVYLDRSLVLLVTDPQFNVAAEVLTADPDPSEVEEETDDTTLSGIPVDDLDTTTTSSTTTTTTTPTSQPTTESVPGATTTSSTSTTTTTIVDIAVGRETGNLTGQGADRPLLLQFIDDTVAFADLKVGAVVDTAGGLQSLAPQGLPIGQITRIVRQPGTRVPIVEVTPNARLDQLNFVSVVLYVPNPQAN